VSGSDASLPEICVHLPRCSVGRWCVLDGHVLQKEDNDWMKKCMEYEVEGARPRGRPKKTWREIVEKDCQAHTLNKEDAMDCKR